MTKQMMFPENESEERTPAAVPADGPGFGGAPASDGDPNDFHIDGHTRAVARVGIAAARQALAEAVKRAAARDHKLAA